MKPKEQLYLESWKEGKLIYVKTKEELEEKGIDKNSRYYLLTVGQEVNPKLEMIVKE